MVGGHLIQRQGVTILQMGPGVGGQSHVDGHRLVVPGGQLIDRLIQRIGQPDFIISGIKLHAAAVVPLQVLLYPLGQVRDGLLTPFEQKAVQTHAVVEQTCGIVMIVCFQTAVAHDHAVNHVQLSVNLPQMFNAVVVPHPLGRLLRPVLIRGKQVQMGVNDLHGAHIWARMASSSSLE